MFPATQLRVGMTILFKGEPCKVTMVQHVTPGKGRGMVQSKLRNLKTGTGFENRFRSDEKIERAFLDQQEMEYLYDSGDEYYFMNTESYEQIALSKDDLEGMTCYLMPNVHFKVDMYEGNPVGVEPPKVVEMRVVETAPELKGATATSSLKPATLETGLVVNVPAFIENGQLIRVDTESGAYIERAKG